jgi:hypothetical protein
MISIENNYSILAIVTIVIVAAGLISIPSLNKANAFTQKVTLGEKFVKKTTDFLKKLGIIRNNRSQSASVSRYF